MNERASVLSLERPVVFYTNFKRRIEVSVAHTSALMPTIFLTLVALTLITANAHAQGCAQCLDSTRATPPAVQAAYRHAILLLGGFAASLFVAGTLFLRNHR